MSNALVVKVIECFRDLLEEFTAYRFFYLAIRALLFDVLVQANATNKVSYDANGFGSFN